VKAERTSEGMLVSGTATTSPGQEIAFMTAGGKLKKRWTRVMSSVALWVLAGCAAGESDGTKKVSEKSPFAASNPGESGNMPNRITSGQVLKGSSGH